MGKIKKKLDKPSRHETLDQQIIRTRYAKPSTRIKERSRRDEDEEFVDSKLTHKILQQARKQQEDLEEEVGLSESCVTTSVSTLLSGCDFSEDKEAKDDAACIDVDVPKQTSNIEINPDDEKALEMFMPLDPSRRAALVDVIKEKLTEKQTEMSTIFGDSSIIHKEENETVIQVYKNCAELLSSYRQGPLPKPIKALPKFTNWEQILNLTQPDKWTAAAMFQLTRIFSSNLSSKMAQRFYNKILLPRLRDDISYYKELNPHLYQALKKAIFKPSAFYKGIIIPLCESAEPCTLREATIIGSVIAKCSIPILDSSAAMLVLLQMDFSGGTCIILTLLLKKKYALPLKVIDAVHKYFMRFEKDERKFPVLWHQCLLAFVELYKNDLSPDQCTDLLRLIKVHCHEVISKNIDELLTPKNSLSGQSVVMSESM